MNYTFLSILLIASLGIPAYGYHPQSVRTSAVEEKRAKPIKDAHYCNDQLTSRKWEYRKAGIIVRMKPFVLSSSMNRNN
jgi:hypothetical protein